MHPSRVLPVIALAAALWLSVSGPVYAGQEGEPQSAPADAACIPAEKCCRICEGGQACGQSCIASNKTCHKGRGCACNASEVCGH